MILENVRNLITHDNGVTWNTIRKALEDIGYNIIKTPIVVGPKDFGIPQLRERAIILAVLGDIGVILVFSLRPKRERWIKETGIVWATEYHITYLSNKDLTDSINFALRRVVLSVSPFNKHSLVTAINEGKSDSLNPILIDLVHRSMDIHKATEGAFDPTISPLINAWGFGYDLHIRVFV